MKLPRTTLPQYPLFFLETGNSLAPYFIHSLTVQGNKAYVKFEEVDTIEEASKLVKARMFLQKSARAKSGPGEFYNDEIIDFQVS